MPLSREDVDSVTRGLAPAIKSYVAAAEAKTLARLDVLAARLEALEKRPVVHGRDGRDHDPAQVRRQIVEEVRAAVAAIPKPQDGLGFDDMALEQTDDREAVLKFTRGERTKVFRLTLPGFVDKGVWREGLNPELRRGDAVSWSGAIWFCTRDAPTGRPGDSSGDFRLAVKKGRDGTDGKDGVLRPPPGPVKSPAAALLANTAKVD